MSDPRFPLGVKLMDDDHAHLEDLFETAPQVPDDRLVAFLDEVRGEIADHFSREEDLMRAAHVPVLECHVAQHRRLLEDIDGVREKAGAIDRAQLRTFLTRDVPNLVMAHVASVDQMSARYLSGDLDPDQVSRLRLPQEGQA